MEVLTQIKQANGQQIYNFMRQIEKRKKDGECRSEFRDWWDACVARAIELNANKFGDWEEAKSKLNQLSEPLRSLDGQHRICVYLESINGYPCIYVKEVGKNEINSRVYITNPKKNCIYLREFGEVTEKQARKIFN